MDAPEIPPHGPTPLDATVLICTYNRARDLGVTLDSLAGMRVRSGLAWDVVVVDNNSTDNTRDVVQARVASFPVPLRYLFEPAQGKSNALNTGMRTTPARIIVFTDDDVRVPESWLDEAVGPLLERDDLDYTGGPVRPLWAGRRPRWLDERGNLGGTIAVKDHGPDAFVFEERKKTPLGVNMAVRRALVERVGGFRPDFGRNGASLLGQEQAEFFYRSRRAGARGLYAPGMVLDHVVPASRLTRRYFRRWWYWKGVSHARLHRVHHQTELGIDLDRVRRVGGIPRFVFGNALRDLRAWAGALLRRDRPRAAEHAWMLAYFLGYCRECRAARASLPASPAPHTRSASI